MFSVQFISIEGHAIKSNHDIRNLRVKTEISNGTEKSNFACLSAVVQKDKFGFIHEQKTVERASVCMGGKSRERENVGRQITAGFRVHELFTWPEVTWPASGPVIHTTCTHTFISTASRRGKKSCFTEHTADRGF